MKNNKCGFCGGYKDFRRWGKPEINCETCNPTKTKMNTSTHIRKYRMNNCIKCNGTGELPIINGFNKKIGTAYCSCVKFNKDREFDNIGLSEKADK